MDLKKVDELLRMSGNCQSTVELLKIELLSKIAYNTTRMVDLLGGQMELPFNKPVQTAPEFKEKVESKVKEAVEVAIEKKVEETAPKKEKPKAELPTKDEVMPKLVSFIQDNGEEALAKVFKELGDYKNFPAVPQDKYPELLTKIS